MFKIGKIGENEYFHEQDAIMEISKPLYDGKNWRQKDENELPKKQFYEFLPFHPVSVTSEMSGTSVEELYMHNYPSKRSWETSRMGVFPQELIVRLNYRSHIKYILLRSKVNRPIPEVLFYIGDGIGGSFIDAEFRKIGQHVNINEEGVTIKVDGIGNYFKLVFPKQPRKTLENPFGQTSLSQLKLFGKQINHLMYYNDFEDEKQDDIDNILINLGLPLNDPVFFLTDQNYEIAPVDDDTRWTLKDMLKILKRAENAKDYEMMKKVKTDIKRVYFIGNEILNNQRKMNYAKSSEKFDLCIYLRSKLENLMKTRDNYDAIYETSRFEEIIRLQRPSTADLLADEDERLKKVKLEKDKDKEEKQKKIKDEKERQEIENNKVKEKYTKFSDNSKFVDYVKTDLNVKKEFTDELAYNQGDKDLEPYFNPLVRKAKSKIPPPNKTKLEVLKRLGVLNVAGVRLFSAMIASDWTLREAAILAFHDFLKNPLLPRYFKKTINLFNCAIELAKLGVEDKVVQIYIESIQILATCLSPPICGNDIPPQHIQKQIKYFIPIIIRKISELNLRQRDHSLVLLIGIFKHPALNVGDLVKGCMDILERNDGVTPDKQPAFTLLARLEIILRVLEEYGVDENLWDWYTVFNELVIPSLFHNNPDCKLVAQQIIVLFYQYIGEDIKIMIEDPFRNVKPQIKQQLILKMQEIDSINKKRGENDLNYMNKSDKMNDSKDEIKMNKLKGSKNDLDPIVEANNDHDYDHDL